MRSLCLAPVAQSRLRRLRRKWGTMKRTLSVAADISIIIAAIVVAVVALRARPIHPPDRPDPVRIKVDQQLTLPGVDFTRTKMTLVLVASSGCRYCTTSLPFYRRLSESDARKAGAFQLIVVGRESVETMEDYLKRAAVGADAVISVDGPANPSALTPTLFLVNRRGIVTNVWRGFQSPSGERSVEKALS